ncbi:hypothetical protein [Saccharopolyspora elongata]|uniref:Polymerase nucleotidyl transferase domain-containing protein n=1 Tax=Saccharopolyspora elongata TaxID=2530387 RepID=A0A4V6PDN3_9PSEU|nr:hypothetical protein [Saccharopolyspora elongata]TDD40307.1 hypothetical protein E1288_35855 [Saccharopolyspora elongata]
MFIDCDHVVTRDGRIHRVVGTLDYATRILAYNVYSPHPDGDRAYQGKQYRKNFEDTAATDDVLQLYRLLPADDIAQHHDPVAAARYRRAKLESTVWADLYDELANVFSDDAVGVFGSAMLGMHLTEHGAIRKDVDFVIHGNTADTVPVLAERLPAIRSKLGFTDVTVDRQQRQLARYQKVFRHPSNSLSTVISRRWTALQLSPQVVTTIRLRDPARTMPMNLVAPASTSLTEVVVTGEVTDISHSALFPITFTLHGDDGPVEVAVFWWKFTTPVRLGDRVSVCGSFLPSTGTVRVTHFSCHWLTIIEPAETR